MGEFFDGYVRIKKLPSDICELVFQDTPGDYGTATAKYGLTCLIKTKQGGQTLLELLTQVGSLDSADGRLEVFQKSKNRTQPVFLVDGRTRLLKVFDEDDNEVLCIWPQYSQLTVGGKTQKKDGTWPEGDISVLGKLGVERVRITGAIDKGAKQPGHIVVRDKDGDANVWIDGDEGDVKLKGADCAEEFDVSGSETVEPGMVVVADRWGRVRPCRKARDSRVVGVVSGAGGLRAGIVLHKTASRRMRVPIALAGRVYCRVDCSFGTVRAGDILTSSPTPGHAMRVPPSDAARGTVIGKALGAARRGSREVLMLVMPG